MILYNIYSLIYLQTENWTKSSLTHAQELTKHTIQMIFLHSYQNSINLCILLHSFIQLHNLTSSYDHLINWFHGGEQMQFDNQIDLFFKEWRS